jgi:hypothetical protein
MVDLGSLSAVAALRESLDELDFARRRVASAAQTGPISAAQSAPFGGASGWVGPAGWAYRRALTLLGRDLDAVEELLRSASDLTSAALYQLGHGD